jgi:hypothetical protein
MPCGRATRAGVRDVVAGARDEASGGRGCGRSLAEQLLVFAFLDVAVEVRDAAALLGAAVDGVQPAVGELEPLALPAALEPVHVYREGERLAGRHRVVQPPNVRAPYRGVHRDRLLHIAVE